MSADDRVLRDQVASQGRARREELLGIYRGKVVALGTKADGKEERLGQLQAQVVEAWGSEDTDLPWANPAFAFSGDEYGLFMLPQAGDGVWIMFEGGHSDRPVWCGGWWSENHKLAKGAAEKVRVLVTPEGHRLVLDDDQGELKLEHAKGTHITVGENEIKLEVQGGAKIVIGKGGVKINDTAFEVKK